MSHTDSKRTPARKARDLQRKQARAAKRPATVTERAYLASIR